MRGEVEAFLDDTPGEIRGMVARDGRFERLIIQREDDPPQHRLGARCVGRVLDVEAGYRAAFVDLGVETAPGFLPLPKDRVLREGDHIEVEVTAEPRERKGPTLRLIGQGQGAPRLLTPGPDVRAILAALAPGVEVQTGLSAIQASWDAEEEALGQGDFFAEAGVDLAVQRTRALIAVDIDYAHLPGKDAKKGRERANREGLIHAARLIRLANWGGLVVIDLVGTNLNADVVNPLARAAFDADGAVFGPLSRFGLLQLALPWGRTPIEDRLNDGDRRPGVMTRAMDLTRRLRHAILSDTTMPRFTAVCAPDEAQAAAPFVARLGPRAALRADPTVAPGRSAIVET
ncbi:ribonuclease E/G [Brevundimonas sp.]|uniref:ribonuclease E/G n=1 Tax=Brevundimonas sp. TaxID=1871086 RepID=UPI002FD95926